MSKVVTQQAGGGIALQAANNNLATVNLSRIIIINSYT